MYTCRHYIGIALNITILYCPEEDTDEKESDDRPSVGVRDRFRGLREANRGPGPGSQNGDGGDDEGRHRPGTAEEVPGEVACA